MTVLAKAVLVIACLAIVCIMCGLGIEYLRLRREAREAARSRRRKAAPPESGVRVARSPLAGARHGSDEYAALTPGYEAKHRDTGIRTPASSPIVWADTRVMDGPETQEFRRLVGLDASVAVLRTQVRPEGNPQASWARQALDLADMEA